MKLALPPRPADIGLNPWPAASVDAWSGLADGAATLSRGAGTGRAFQELVNEARAFLSSQDVLGLAARAQDRRFVRAIAVAWFDEETARTTMTSAVLAVLRSARVSRLGTIALASILLEHFARLDAWQPGLYVELRDLVRVAVGQQAAREGRDLVETLREQDRVTLELDGPELLSRALVAAGVDPLTWLREMHLSGSADSRFGWMLRDRYYLERIAATDAADGDHGFLATVEDEVLLRQRTASTDEDGDYFGHQVLTALTAKDTRHPNRAWLRAVLGVGGDPRLVQTPEWRLWWSKVPEANVRRAVRWMYGMDLRAFLDGVEAYAEATRNEPMMRLLEPRKRLLLGLYEQDRVDDVRLVVGSDIRRWINRSATFALNDIARLDDPIKQDTAIVYLDCGTFWVVEGSHNFQLQLFVGGPPPRLADRRRTSFDVATLRDTIPSLHRETHGESSHVSIWHRGRQWIQDALDFLRVHGAHLDELGLLSRSDYIDLVNRRDRPRY